MSPMPSGSASTTFELLPVAEFPFDGSWGYQITGYYSPSGRFGEPDDLRAFVDRCHSSGIGVVLDWVPAHFVRDEHGLGKFDGTALYEHSDPRQGEHPDWGTYIFNYGRSEVRNFLIANCLYWFEEFHIDGLRVDAVASMLYLDYSREEGEWIPNRDGGRENLAAIDLLRELSSVIGELYPGPLPDRRGIDRLGRRHPSGREQRPRVHFQVGTWGWMHDTLSYFGTDPYFRSGVHDQLTFAMIYEHSEAFCNPLSHDEVVHGKGSLYDKMPGNADQKLANLRCLLAYQFTRPGKKLLFMGSEIAPELEWGFRARARLGKPRRSPPTRGSSSLWPPSASSIKAAPVYGRAIRDSEGFQWISCEDSAHSTFVYRRRTVESEGDTDSLVVILNLTPVARPSRSFSLPEGRYRIRLNSDRTDFGGGGQFRGP